jgi:phospholipid/cholesterol/gamma-HCH transport system substrate-binding protein
MPATDGRFGAAMKITVENRARLAFVILVLLGAAIGFAWIHWASGQYATYEIHTLDPVSGLIADAPVEFHGVDVGRVKRVTLTDPHSVNIVLSVRNDAPVTMATVATITARGLATRGFTGYVYVSLEDVGTDLRPLVAAPGSALPVIPTAPSRSVNLDTAISQVNQNVQLMSDLLQTLLDRKTIVALKQSVDSLQHVTSTLAANNEKLGTIISNTERASNEFKPLLQTSNDTVKALQTQVLPEAQKTIAKLDQLSTSLNSVASKIERDPSVLLRGTAPPAPGPGESR